MMDFIPYGRQCIDEADIAAVVAILKSDFLTQGPAIDRFENVVASYVGAKHALAVCNATAALHLSCLTLGVGPGDLVWTVPNTFVASANCALYCGADIDFVDIDPKTYNISVEKLEEKLISARRHNRLPKVIIPVHFSGQSCDMIAIKKLSEEYGFKIIEDASHAVGAEYLGEKVGNCRYSDMAVFSFHPVKIITTGEGGMIFTNDDAIAQRLMQLRTHGITRDIKLLGNKSEGAWYYELQSLGFNYRITDVQCALGLSQMHKLDSFLFKRRSLVSYYNEKLKNISVTTPFCHYSCLPSWHLYVILLDEYLDRKYIFNKLRESEIGVNVHYIPVHFQPLYKNKGFKVGDYPVSENYYKRAITLPLHPKLSYRQVDYIVQSLASAIETSVKDGNV